MQIQLFSCQNVCENYVPVVSQISELYKLVCGCGSTEATQHHYALLGKGSLIRSIVLMIPVLGNLIIFLYDVARQRALHRVLEDWQELEHVSGMFKDDVEIVRAAVLQNEAALEFVSQPLQATIGAEIELGIHTVRADGLALRNCGWLKGVKSVVKEAVYENEEALQYATPELQESMRNDIGTAIEYMPSDADVVHAVMTHPDLVWLTGVFSVMQCAIEKDPDHLRWASKRLQDNETLVRLATKKNPEALWFASERVQKRLSEVRA